MFIVSKLTRWLGVLVILIWALAIAAFWVFFTLKNTQEVNLQLPLYETGAIPLSVAFALVFVGTFMLTALPPLVFLVLSKRKNKQLKKRLEKHLSLHESND